MFNTKVRLTDNLALLKDDDFEGMKTEEPQVMFHRASTETFNERMRYGRRSKIELLWRLQIYKKSDYNFYPWEKVVENDTLVASELTGTCGMVARLFSGNKLMELSKKERVRSRSISIRKFVDDLDSRNDLEF